MKMIVVAVTAVIAAVAASGFAWQRNQLLEETRAELASANSQLQKVKAEFRSMETELGALRKESTEQKMATDQLRAELTVAKSFLDAEKGASTRLREELAKTKELLASLSRARAAQAAPPLRVIKGSSGSAVGVGVPAK